MTRVIVDPATLVKLVNLTESAELCDIAGRTVGYFSPAAPDAGPDPLVSDDELLRRQQEGGGRELSAILADLETGK